MTTNNVITSVFFNRIISRVFSAVNDGYFEYLPTSNSCYCMFYCASGFLPDDANRLQSTKRQ